MNKPALSKTAAIREAMTCVSIAGSRTSYHVYGPYRPAEPSGPSTEVTADSWSKARLIRAGWRAEIAVALMGRLDEHARFSIDRDLDDPYANHSVPALVTAALAERAIAVERVAQGRADWAALSPKDRAEFERRIREPLTEWEREMLDRA